MLVVFGITFVILILFVIGTAIGVLFKRQPIAGSCGGLGALGIERACGCKVPCKSAQERMSDIEAEKAQAEFDARYKVEFAHSKDNDYVNNREGEGKFSVRK